MSKGVETVGRPIGFYSWNREYVIQFSRLIAATVHIFLFLDRWLVDVEHPMRGWSPSTLASSAATTILSTMIDDLQFSGYEINSHFTTWTPLHNHFMSTLCLYITSMTISIKVHHSFEILCYIDEYLNVISYHQTYIPINLFDIGFVK